MLNNLCEDGVNRMFTNEQVSPQIQIPNDKHQIPISPKCSNQIVNNNKIQYR